MNSFQQAMGELDAAVTGKSFQEATRQFHHMPQTVEKWIAEPGGNPCWYLSDSGYSRVVFSLESGSLFLTSNSTSKAKANWEAAKPQRDAAEAIIKADLTAIYPECVKWWIKSAGEIVDDLLR